MISGREALASIEQAVQSLRGDESRLEAALRSATDEAARARQVETDGFRALARVKLDLMAGKQLASELDATEKRALDLIAGEQAALAELDRKRDDALAALTAAEDEKRLRGSALNLAIAAVEAKQREVSATITQTAAWKAARQAVEDAKEVAQAAAEKSQRAADDLAQKRKPYENDALFMYLWTRNHATANDRSGFFVRFFDRKVARLIDYPTARANYATLLAVPERLTAHAESRRQAIDEAAAAQAKLERQALIAAGIAPLEDALAAAQQKDQAAQAKVASCQALLQSIDKERADLQSQEGSGRAAAISLLADRLARADLRQLYAEAFKTPTPDDENALNAISRARQQIASADTSVTQIRTQIQTTAQRRSQLEIARDQARAQGYDSPWGNFINHVLIADMVRGIVIGALSASDLGRAMASEYQRRDPGYGSGWSGGFGGAGSSSPWGAPPAPSPPSESGWRTTDSF